MYYLKQAGYPIQAHELTIGEWTTLGMLTEMIREYNGYRNDFLRQTRLLNYL